MAEERHAFVSDGISRETFTELAVKLTTKDPELRYFVHMHNHAEWHGDACDDGCLLFVSGQFSLAVLAAARLTRSVESVE